jgi:hypothetical protein
MNILKITLLDSETQTDPKSISLSINSKLLFIGRVDLRSLKKWLLDNENAIRDDAFPIEKYTDCSLAESSYHFYEDIDADNDDAIDAIDAMYNYRESHCLRFACRGTDFPDVYIGKNGAMHEISIYSSDEKWRYFFDVDDFFSELT